MKFHLPTTLALCLASTPLLATAQTTTTTTTPSTSSLAPEYPGGWPRFSDLSGCVAYCDADPTCWCANYDIITGNCEHRSCVDGETLPYRIEQYVKQGATAYCSGLTPTGTSTVIQPGIRTPIPTGTGTKTGKGTGAGVAATATQTGGAVVGVGGGGMEMGAVAAGWIVMQVLG